ncbi:hypothetical protein [Motilibacter aurantiacus]|nr:hypothetical protein [Motilibacter aurantiacus]
MLGTVGGAALCARDTVVDSDEFGRRAAAALGTAAARTSWPTG